MFLYSRLQSIRLIDQIKNGLYHCEVYWEDEIQNQIDAALNLELPLKFDEHAIDNTYERNISISGIKMQKLKNGYCFEAEVKNNKVIKFVIRYGYDDTYDLSSVWYSAYFSKFRRVNKPKQKQQINMKMYIKNARTVKKVCHLNYNCKYCN